MSVHMTIVTPAGVGCAGILTCNAVEDGAITAGATHDVSAQTMPDAVNPDSWERLRKRFDSKLKGRRCSYGRA